LAKEKEQASEQQQQSRRGSKRKRVDDEEEDHVSNSSQSQAPRRSQRNRSTQQPATVPDVHIIDDDDADDNYAPEDGLVACPICRRRMKEENVFSHLNVCDGTAGSSSPKRPSRTPTPLVQAPPPKPVKPQDRLPSFNYTLLKETALRKKLQDLNIPSFGPKPLLQRRHIEWVNLWNANCDSSRPRSRKELLADLDRWEKTLGGRSRDGGTSTEVNEVMKKDFDGAGWAKTHKSDFDDLIADARRKRELQKTEEQSSRAQEHTPAPESESAKTATGIPSTIQPPPAPHPPEHVDRPISPVPGFDLSRSVNGATPDLTNGDHLPTTTTSSIPSAQQPPPAPHPSEYVDRPISPVAGFDLKKSIREGMPELGEAGHIQPTRSNSITFSNGQTGVNSQVWQGESKMRKMPMFQMPGDPVTDTEMSGFK